MVKEKELVDWFIDCGYLKGIFLREVPVGFSEILKPEALDDEKAIAFATPYTKKIDLICIESIGTELDRELRVRKLPPWHILARHPIKIWEWLSIRREFKGRNVWLIEVKRRLNAESLGQILVDKYMFEMDNRNYFNIKELVIVYLEEDPIVKSVCKQYGITTVKVVL